MENRVRDAQVEPLFAALKKETPVKEEVEREPRPARRGLGWKLFWVGLLFGGLLVLAVKQST